MIYIGYGRVSTEDQNGDLQMDALRKLGCKKIFFEKEHGHVADRPKLLRALHYVQAGETLVVWKLDRLGRSLVDLCRIVDDLLKRGVHFRSLTDNIDTSSPSGKLQFHILGACAEYERAIIAQRTKAGVAAYRERNGGRWGARPKLNDGKREEMRKFALTRGILKAAEKYEISRWTVQRAITAAEERRTA